MRCADDLLSFAYRRRLMTYVLHISGITVSGHFLEFDDCPARMATGASCAISVIFSPVAGTLVVQSHRVTIFTSSSFPRLLFARQRLTPGSRLWGDAC
jgi:hypothetical protein